MEADSIQTQAYLEKSYWWFLGRRRIIETVLHKFFSKKGLQILDWGCGAGGNHGLLESYGVVTGVDSSDEALKFCREKGITNLVKAGTVDEFVSSTPASSFDLVTAFDVLEHIPQDREYLKDLHKVLKPGGYVLITVPAFQFLWSELDDRVGHQRRYTRAGLSDKLEDAGFTPVKASYFISSMFLPILVYRFLGKITGRSRTPKFTYVEFPRPINWLLTELIYFESALLQKINLPFGSSFIILARRKT